jgi:hypothetical protein
LIIGCSANEEATVTVEKNDGQYDYVKEMAWEFIKERQWEHTTNKDWKSAVVEEGIVKEGYELLTDDIYVGKKVWMVTFQDKENLVTGTPVILVDLSSNEVVGFIASE